MAQGRSDLSRFSRVLAAHLENTREDKLMDLYDYNDDASAGDFRDAEEDFRMTHSIADPVRRAEKSDIKTEVTEDQASRMLQNYRKTRNAGYDQPFSQEDIRDAYKARHDY